MRGWIETSSVRRRCQVTSWFSLLTMTSSFLLLSLCLILCLACTKEPFGRWRSAWLALGWYWDIHAVFAQSRRGLLRAPAAPSYGMEVNGLLLFNLFCLVWFLLCNTYYCLAYTLLQWVFFRHVLAFCKWFESVPNDFIIFFWILAKSSFNQMLWKAMERQPLGAPKKSVHRGTELTSLLDSVWKFPSKV